MEKCTECEKLDCWGKTNNLICIDTIFVKLKKKPKLEKVNKKKDVKVIYTYHELLSRVFSILEEQNLVCQKQSYKIVPPVVQREGRKTVFCNVKDIATRMKRPCEHLIQFLFAELCTQGSLDGNQRLVIKGKFQPNQIETILKRYIAEYVMCKTCKSAESVLQKENRLYFVTCQSCGSKRSVSTVKTGFVAQTGKRVKT